MDHYFFHITDGKRTFEDEVGRTFATSVAAEGHAVVIASELAADDGWERFSVVVENSDRSEIARVPINGH